MGILRNVYVFFCWVAKAGFEVKLKKVIEQGKRNGKYWSTVKFLKVRKRKVKMVEIGPL